MRSPRPATREHPLLETARESPSSNGFYLFVALLGLRRCARAFSSCGPLRCALVVVRRLLTAVAALAA